MVIVSKLFAGLKLVQNEWNLNKYWNEIEGKIKMRGWVYLLGKSLSWIINRFK